MRTKINVKELLEREYWTPNEAARILGRSRRFWSEAFDAGRVKGYPQTSPGGRRYRYLSVASARNYLNNLAHQDKIRKSQKAQEQAQRTGTALARFGARLRGEGGSL